MSLPGPEIYEGIESTAGRLGLVEDLQGWNSTHPAFEYFLNETNDHNCFNSVVIEVGSWKGASVVHMANVSKHSRFYCVDTWLGGADHVLSDLPQDHIPKLNGYPQLYFQFLYNVNKAGFAGRVVPLPMTSAAGAKVLAREKIVADLIYIDGSHEYADVWADLCAYWDLVRPGGIMFGDDWGFLGVQAAVLRFASERNLAVALTDKNFWSFTKAE